MRKFVNGSNDLVFQDNRDGERGLTLIELIASLTLMSVVLGIIYASITFGINAYHKVSVENKLRDEGDLIMSAIISELYRMGPERISQSLTSDHAIRLIMPKTADGGLNEEVIAFQANADGKAALFIGTPADVDQRKAEIATESEIVLTNKKAQANSGALAAASADAGLVSDSDASSIKLDCFGVPVSGGCSSGLIEIRLKLRQAYGGRSYDLDLESKFGF